MKPPSIDNNEDISPDKISTTKIQAIHNFSSPFPDKIPMSSSKQQRMEKLYMISEQIQGNKENPILCMMSGPNNASGTKQNSSKINNMEATKQYVYTHSIHNIFLELLFCSKYPELETIYGATSKMIIIVHTKLHYYFAMFGLY